MSTRIIGVTVGTPTSPMAMAEKLKPVTSINGKTPDENGNVDIAVGSGSGQNASLTTAQVNALDGLFRLAKYESDPTGAYAAFCAAFGITAKTLEGITAVYSGGEVAVGTALTALDGITVTATYSDGSTETVTAYTLSGEIAEGSNTITVSYGGMTATITVVGVAAGEDPAVPLYGRFWPPKSKVRDWNVPEWEGVENFVYTSNINGSQSVYEAAGLPSASFMRLEKLQGTVYIRTLTKEQYGVLDYAYKVYANSDGTVETGGFTNVTPTIHRNIGSMDIDGVTYYFVLFEFNIPAGQVGVFCSQANPMSAGYFASADLYSIDEEYRPYYTLFDSNPKDRITEAATEVA